jgi:serine/threonine-protein kinase HipA
MTMPEPLALEVLLHRQPIGRLTLLDGDRSIFSFTERYREQPDRPVLSLSFKDRFGQLLTEHRPYQTRLSPFFSNLLPEGQLRHYLAALAGVKPVRELFLLWALGRDLPGAVTVRAAGERSWPPTGEQGEQQEAPGQEPRQGLLRFSLAGVQLKFSAVLGARGGLTIPAEGVGGGWIVKLPSAQFAGVPENEYTMLTLAQRVGIEVPEIALVAVDEIGNLPRGIERIGGQALAIRRFDRAADGAAIHIEDFAQVFGLYPEDKYARATMRNLAIVIGTECGLDDVAELIRRLTFNTLVGNADMHLKNWSLIYPDGRKARLAPAYDFVSTIPYLPDDKAALKVSRSARFTDFSVDELTHLAEKARLPRHLVLETALATASRFLDIWSREKKQLAMAPAVSNAIEQHLQRIPLVARVRSGTA